MVFCFVFWVSSPSQVQQCINCVLNLSVNERKCLLQAKQGVYAIISHDNFKTKSITVFCFL